MRWTVGGARALVVWLAGFLYASSWALFWNTGVFLDRQAFAFLAAMDPVQVFHWVHPPLAIGVVVTTLIVTITLARWVPNWVARRRPETQRQLVLTAGAALGICVVAALTGKAIYGSEAIAPDQPKSVYAVMRDDRVGPRLTRWRISAGGRQPKGAYYADFPRQSREYPPVVKD